MLTDFPDSFTGTITFKAYLRGWLSAIWVFSWARAISQVFFSR